MATGTILFPMPGEFATHSSLNPPGFEYENSRPHVLFDDTTVETMIFAFEAPANYASAPVLKAKYKMASATTGKIDLEASIMALSSGDAANTDSYDTVNAANETVPGTVGNISILSITMTNADTMAAGDKVYLKLERDADDATNDTATSDLELIGLELQYTTV